MGQGFYEAHYVPWGSQDLQNLISSLPDILQGAGPMLGALEEEMSGKMLALGDLKALLSKLLGTEQLTQIMTRAQLPQVVNSHQADGVQIDPHRTTI